MAGRARGAARAALARLATRQPAGTAGTAEPAHYTVAKLRQRLHRNQQEVARLQERVTALEEEVSEARRIGLQVAHLGDVVTMLLARRAADSDAEFAEDLSGYADDI